MVKFLALHRLKVRDVAGLFALLGVPTASAEHQGSVPASLAAPTPICASWFHCTNLGYGMLSLPLPKDHSSRNCWLAGRHSHIISAVFGGQQDTKVRSANISHTRPATAHVMA